MPSGYSTTPLHRKLGFKAGYHVALFHPPDNYFDLLAGLPDDITTLKSLQKESADLIHLFVASQMELEQQAGRHIRALKRNGILWISWPKASSGIITDLKRDLIREYVLALGLVDIKIASIDEKWSGLKFMYRTKDRLGQ